MTTIQALTRFIFVADDPRPADICFLPGGPEDGPCRLAARLYHQGFFPLILPSGRFSITQSAYGGEEPTEWAHMRRLLLSQGVPEAAILREDAATYTWQNARFSRRVTDSLGLSPAGGILCCMAHHARRALAYYEMAFPHTRLTVCPAPLPGVTREDWFKTQAGVDAVFAELQRFARQMPGMAPFRPQAP